ncbi:antibiotic biosynthesis monooxygenase [Vibrio sp. qd031]|uniref:antibiotic biosynthesis monooxygenase family protein n=1 Tax=Vibrio sp. qd031 TaxID=1603038 RepID=UPI000A1135C1|nr:antibiotic biosynthesis monooxygenase [Vibrio sp. qd031]ORT48764.1 antibiotic biosynthesis monooxygenase [Vibrio sp. qd031]
MFTVIFRAKAGAQDSHYDDMVQCLRALAFDKYGCLDFITTTHKGEEIAISYWQSEQDIVAWRKDGQHQLAQQLGKDKWYLSYRVEVFELKRHYQFDVDQ